jgi:hypothetical protein
VKQSSSSSKIGAGHHSQVRGSSHKVILQLIKVVQGDKMHSGFRTNPLIAMMGESERAEDAEGGVATVDADTGKHGTDDEEDCLVL